MSHEARSHPCTRRPARCVPGVRAALLALVVPVVCLGLVTRAAPARAGYPAGWTDAELALTSPFCQDVQTMRYGDAYSNTSPNAKKWVAIMGKGFWAVHHYCWAQINLARAERPTTGPAIRQDLREGAVADMVYVINNTPPDFILLPEIYTRKGQVELLLNRVTDARLSFSKARTLKPDYWPPYFQWAQYVAGTGHKAEARKIVEEGLAYAPTSNTLRKYLVELGGDPAKVKPRQVPSKAPSPTAELDQSASK